MRKDDNRRFTRGLDLRMLPHHNEIPFVRKVFANADLFSGCKTHIAVHFVQDAEQQPNRYAEAHTHDVDEFNLVLGLGGDGDLVYRITLGSDTFEVESPHSIYIPKGTLHSAEAVRGSGLFVCIVLKGKLP
jgi:mannose-6-phosphate isomerase-like protein (cupin superfamily)